MRVTVWHLPIVVPLIAAVALVGCISEEPTSDDAALTACESAFATAAAVSDLEDTVEDLDPAVESCATVEEWTSASERFPDALDGADPVNYLTNRCRFGALSATDLCAAFTPDTSGEAEAFAAQACSGSSYARCESSLPQAMEFWPGRLVAICEYEDDQGDVILLGDASEAESRCSADGLIDPSRVFDVVTLP